MSLLASWEKCEKRKTMAQHAHDDGTEGDGDYSIIDESSSSSDDDDDVSFDSEGDTIADPEHGNNHGILVPATTAPTFIRQHLPAIVIAIVAAVLGHAHLTDEFIHVTLAQTWRELADHLGAIGDAAAESDARTSAPVTSPTLTVPTPYSLPSRGGDDRRDHEHYMEYRRTHNIGFCPEHGDKVVAASSSERVRRLLLELDANSYQYRSIPVDDHGDDDDNGFDPNLVPFDFRISKDLVLAMGLHYAADESGDDLYANILATTGDVGSDNSGVNDIMASIKNREYRCLVDKVASNNIDGFYAKGWSVAYIQPDVATFYRNISTESKDSAFATDDIFPKSDDVSGRRPEMPSVKRILKERREEYLENNPDASAAAAKREEAAVLSTPHTSDDVWEIKGREKITAVPTTFTGFAAKFTNLSPQMLKLYWDGRGGSATRLVGRIAPFDSLGTATTPGQSFSIIGDTYDTYDDRYVIQRWTMTVDEAHVYYNPYSPGSGRSLSELTSAQRSRYDMWRLNQVYARDYLIKTKRTWLSDYPRPAPFHYMWKADYFGRIWDVKSFERHFTTMPMRSELGELGYDEHERRGHREARYGKEMTISLANHRKIVGENSHELDMKLEVISCAPRVFQIDNFLSDVEIEHIIGLVQDGSRNISLSQSTVHPGGGSYSTEESGGTDGQQSNEQTDKATRSSTNAWIEREASPIIDAIYRRAADLLRIDESLLRHRSDEEHPELATDHSIAERMQLVHYAEGEEYAPHHDFNYPAFGNRYQPGRFATLLLYLNDVEEGGETVFPRAISSEYHDGISVKPKAGKALLFYNTLPDGNKDDLSQHQSKRVLRGEKWMANLWVWDPIID